MKNTIVENIPSVEFEKITAGVKNFIFHKSKVEPEAGQRLLLIEEGFTGKEILTEVNYVEKGPGLFKGHYILQFPKQEPARKIIDLTNGIGAGSWTREELSSIDTTGIQVGSVI